MNLVRAVYGHRPGDDQQINCLVPGIVRGRNRPWPRQTQDMREGHTPQAQPAATNLCGAPHVCEALGHPSSVAKYGTLPGVLPPLRPWDPPKKNGSLWPSEPDTDGKSPSPIWRERTGNVPECWLPVAGESPALRIRLAPRSTSAQSHTASCGPSQCGTLWESSWCCPILTRTEPMIRANLDFMAILSYSRPCVVMVGPIHRDGG